MIVRRIATSLRKRSRLIVSIVVVVVVWWATLAGVRTAQDDETARGLEDRARLANVLAAPVAARLHAIAGDRMRIDGKGIVREPTGELARLRDTRPRACDGDGAFDQLIARARVSTSRVVSGVIDVPGLCRQFVVAAQRAASADVVVEIERPAAIAASLQPAPGLRTYLVDPRGQIVGTERTDTAPRDVDEFLRSGRAEDAIGVKAEAGDGWSVVLMQDAADARTSTHRDLSVRIATIVTGALAVVLIVIAGIDERRRRAARRSEQAKNAFFSIVGHELRTPLTALRGFTETLASRWEGLDEAKRRMLVDKMVPQGRRMQRTVERLLTAAAIRAQVHIRPTSAPMDVRPLLDAVAADFAAESPLHTFKVTREASAWALADPIALKQALEHLVENAVRFSPEGGRVSLNIEWTRRQVQIVVTDEGVGLPRNTKHLFEPLIQAEDVTTRVHAEGGTGVGLYISRTLVRDMGGDVRACRRESGARFVIALRRAASPATQHTAA